MNPIFKKIGLAIVLLTLVVAAFFYFKSDKKQNLERTEIDPAFGEHISSYTSGVISSNARIIILLAKPLGDSSDIGQEVSAKLFDFNPTVKGKTIWVDTRTIEFTPSEKMNSGQVYKADFFLSKLTSVPPALSTFSFDFQVIGQNYELSIDNLKPYAKTDLKRQKIEGTVYTADLAEAAEVEKLLEATQESKKLAVTWSHAADGKLHSFVIEDVVRGEQSSKVKVLANGTVLRVAKVDEKEVEVPSLSDFKLMNAKVVQSPNQHIILQFSDPLKEKQNLDGLIRISNLSDLDFDIHDNEVWVYPPARQAGTKTIFIEAGIRNILDYRMKAAASAEVVFEQLTPAIRFTGKGTILPSTNGLVLPFEAVNLRAVEVDILKIFENNILQFLQSNNISGNYELNRVGTRILKKTIQLDNMGVTDFGKWNRFTLNLADLIKTEPGAIYQVKLNFNRSHSVYNCEGQEGTTETTDQFSTESSYEGGGYYEDGEYYEDEYYDYYDEEYDWEQRNNPCHSTFYRSDRSIRKNLLASDLGLTAKQGADGETTVFVTDLKTAEPLSGIEVEWYSYQQQVIGKANTDKDGKVSFKANPFVVVAKNGTQRGYLRIANGESLSLSSFDISGEVVQNGLKGFLYGERGVWRPGDSLYLTFLLEDKNKLLPPTHPVVLELSNPQGQVVNRLVRSTAENGFYKFATSTAVDAPTGNWQAKVKVGGSEFAQQVKIETVKPNRLKINLDLGVERITSPDVTADLEVKWLHGAPGRNLKSIFEVLLVKAPTTFAKYKDFVFEDPSRTFSSETQTLFEGSTDGEGKASFNGTLSTSDQVPGFLNAIFRGKVFEESGNFSIDRFSIPFSPYESYVGMKVPEGEKYTGILYLDKKHAIEVVTVNEDGVGVSRNGVEMTVYKLDWRWWWDNSSEYLANYVEGSYSKLIKREVINTVNGKSTWDFEIKSPDWGRYFVRACDPVSGHCTGKIVYVDEPGWGSRARNTGGSGGATILSFTTDKGNYNTGEKATLTIPGSANGRALVSIENGSKVLQTYWVETQAGETKFTFDVKPEMAPNVYVHVSLLQPHAQTTNDLPIRLYGVVPVRVEDPQTHLTPVIEMPEVLEPGEKVTIKISEKEKRRMSYTIAMVDEGLLDITRFKTPDPWNRFYARESLGVRTWDLYDYVIGSYGSHLERLIAVGGDEEGSAKDDDARANRFKPVVKYLGPFTLGAGDEDEHTFIMPQYIGSVKTMVVAAYEGAYGNAEKAVPVRKPLMVLATMPRVLGPQEKLKLPITLFTQEKSIKNVKVEVKTGGPLAIAGSATQNIVMSSAGDMTVEFDLDVKAAVGIGTVEVIATSGSFKAVDKIEIDVRNSNSPITRTTDAILEAGKSWSAEVAPFGLSGTNTAILEVSNMPPINLGSRLRYLIQYPHGCIEQTTSSVFPQLFLDNVKTLSENEKNTIQRNVTVGINRLKSFTQSDGGFGYWPGSAENSDPWGTTYAGHFLIEAEAKGYFVSSDMMKRWKNFQKNKAQEWRRNTGYYNSELMQAYRLYTLALAGSPELGAMNRLREYGDLPQTASWMLAAAYAKAGQPEAAKKIAENLSYVVKPYRELSYSYGSEVRDKALIMETMVALGDKPKAFEMLKELSKVLSNEGYWLSTQEVAFALKAIGSFVGMEKRGTLKFTYKINGKEVTASSELPMEQIIIPISGTTKQSVHVENESGAMLFSRIISTGTPARGNEVDEQQNLSLSVRYTTAEGADIDPATLEQGTEFIAEVSVFHNGIKNNYENLALAQVFPSGWEINNLRLQEAQQTVKSSAFTYQDIRDDRVYTYFNLYRGERKTFKVLLTASYTGTYYLPAVNCEAMYDNGIYARKKGMEVQVVKAAGVQ
ncbi:hypothetical protein SanaruYs_24330 [Chryseotalea sanaruensis]|uniref:Alpha-2-macroglobulin n=1 Tax=Chryseotalea sanaruensis TaxID=2482724 RepID=A0A401UBC9_9BACT|nr:MG2 domain-containing protein [Chryseotalea sanaruensis]GCC52197.1 hypothetical protein SanaruYs_24330 [Chryseotalea sanaruensis]